MIEVHSLIDFTRHADRVFPFHNHRRSLVL